MKEIIRSSYRQYKLDSNTHNLKKFTQSAERAKSILIERFWADQFYSSLTIEDIFSTNFHDLIWKTDDIFENIISELFLNHAFKEFNWRVSASRKNISFQLDQLWTPPRVELNKLFAMLKLEYRFKSHYEIIEAEKWLNEQPKLYQIDSSENIIETDRRRLSDLSDGEKAILSLAFWSLNGSMYLTASILLLDEFDATLNPSLINIFYKLIDIYFIQKWITVILTTHSPTTISQAPGYAMFYEVFKKSISDERVIPVLRENYSDLSLAYRKFYSIISDQDKRLTELEKENLQLQHIIGSKKKKVLIVEDKYTQIYKVAWLVLNDKHFDENNLDTIFDQECDFNIYWYEGAWAVGWFLRQKNVELLSALKVIWLLDFDKEWSENFHFLRKESFRKWQVLWDKKTGFFKKRDDHRCFYSLLLPIPDRLSIRASFEHENFSNHVEIENLLKEEFLIAKDLVEEKTYAWQIYYSVKDCIKPNLRKKLIILEKDQLEDFTPLFTKIETLFNS